MCKMCVEWSNSGYEREKKGGDPDPSVSTLFLHFEPQPYKKKLKLNFRNIIYNQFI